MKLAGSINHWRADPSGWIGSVIMLGFAGTAAWRWQGSGLLFYALTFLRDLAAGWFLLTRREALVEQRFGAADVLAYASSALPLLYFSPSVASSASALLASNVLAILGFAIATVALFELGPSFGVSPANRGPVKSGVYGLVQHPMYAGYVFSELGLCFVNPWNVTLLATSMVLYSLRGRLESAVLKTSVQPA
jgi:protein-S-isoprenylcysteine O-methyltransferase Ste14